MIASARQRRAGPDRDRRPWHVDTDLDSFSEDVSYLEYQAGLCTYKNMALIVWDEPKRQINLVRHGLDFADLDEWFFLDAMTIPAKEGRYMAIGRLNDGTIAVVFAVLGMEGISVISMRPASRKERSLL